MNRFHEFVQSHYLDDKDEISHLSIEDLKSLILDYLAVELFQYDEEEYDNQVNVLCHQLERYLKDPKTFYFNLIVDIVNFINFSGHKGVVLHLDDHDDYRKDEHHYYYSINMNDDMVKSFLFLYGSIHDELKEQKNK